jgi:hypothetical protein
MFYDVKAEERNGKSSFDESTNNKSGFDENSQRIRSSTFI